MGWDAGAKEGSGSAPDGRAMLACGERRKGLFGGRSLNTGRKGTAAVIGEGFEEASNIGVGGDRDVNMVKDKNMNQD